MNPNSTPSSQAICLHPENPHYFLFRGQPTLLITSAEHYGSVINLDFDYLPYLDVLASAGLNCTRIYAGAYLEPEHYFIHDNPLGPPPGRHCLPWGRSPVPGYPLGGNLFDLESWNEEYFNRLKDFLSQAARRGIVVEICLFNAMYPDTWAKMPLYFENNIQHVSRCACRDFQTLKDPALVAYQDAYVSKITREVNEFDNVILEICDEPGIHGTLPEEYTPWIAHLVAAIRATERPLPVKHLIAQQVCGNLDGAGDFSGHPEVQVIVGQYIWEASGAQFGGMQLLDTKYDYQKPIELNETAYYPIWYEGDRAGASRVEGWEFIVGGGGSFNHLNGLFSTFNPAGAGTGNEPILQALKNLKDFMYRFDFTRMRRDPSLLAEKLPGGAFARGMSEPGRQVALYLHHSRLAEIKYIVQPGDYQDSLVLNLAAGSYQADWVDPATGSTLRSEQFQHGGGVWQVVTPPFAVDIALRILAA